MMTFTEHEASELCRFAQAAYRADQNDLGHLCSGVNAGDQVSIERYDRMMSAYREWLVFNTFAVI